MVFLQTQDGNIGEVLQNLEAAVEQRPDGIATTIMDPEAFDGTIQRAMDMGIPVVSYNVDDADGAAGSARMGYMGSNLIKAGYTLGLGISKFFPEEGPIHVRLIGTNDPGQQWSQHRTLGAEMFMEEYAAANPDRDITWANIDAGYDLGVTGARVSSYIQTNPNTTAYLDNGFWEVGVARALRDLGYEPGQVLLGGFDLNTFKLEEMKGNWIQVHGRSAALPAGVPLRHAALPAQQVRAGTLERRHRRADRHAQTRRTRSSGYRRRTSARCDNSGYRVNRRGSRASSVAPGARRFALAGPRLTRPPAGTQVP